MKIVNFTYRLPNKRIIFDDLNANFSDTKLNVLLGPNGEGKTTLLDFIAETNPRPQDHFLGFPHSSEIAYQMQGVPFIGEATVINTLKMIVDIANNGTRFTEQDLPQALKRIAHTKFKNLSGGQRRTVIIEGICKLNKRLYLFDEPESGLDPRMAQNIIQKIANLCTSGKKVIITSHQFQNIEHLDVNLLFLKDGKIRFSGTPQKLLQDSQAKNLLDAYIKTDQHYSNES